MAIYMKYGAIDGAVTAEKFSKWIEVNSFQWGAGRGISTPTGASADREASAPSVSEVTVTKPTDVASAKLLNEALGGEGTKVELVFTTTVKNTIEEFMRYELTNTLVSGYSISSGGDRPQESLSLNFTKVMVKYKDNEVLGGKLGGPALIGYDLATAKVL